MKVLAIVSGGLFVALTLYLGVGVYAMRWGERRLHAVRTGMSQSEVRKVVGQSVRVIDRTNGMTTWDYSKWPAFTEACVHFGTNGLVLAVETD